MKSERGNTMKQESTKKNKKVLWIVLGLASLLAVAGAVLALVLGGFGNDKEPVGGRPDLYWNVARQSHIDGDTGLSVREPAADGLYYVTFAYNGEQVEYPVADKKTVNFIDTMDIMGLVFDNDGIIVDAVVPKEAATEIGKSLYIQNSSKSALIANSSIMMNGMRFNLRINELTEVYECTAAGEFEGVKIGLDHFGVMDTISVYANDKNEVTHIFVINHPVESKVYWRKDFMWSWTNNATSRVPDENGVYTIDFFCEGELVSLKVKDFNLVNQIDNPSRYKCHFGLTFDEEGYVVGQMASALASRTLLQANCFDITEFDGENYTATRLLSNDGAVETGVLSSDCKIYDVSKAAIAEGRQGKQVESLQLGDRVCIWQNVGGEAVLIYVTNRMVDSPAYYLPERKYDSTAKETTRKPNAQGYYEVELLREGEKELTTYKTKDKAMMTLIDGPIDKCVGLKLKDGTNEIEYVYEPECIFGYTHFRRGGYVSDVIGSIIKVLDGSQWTMVDGVLATDCKVYNVSSVGEYGAETTLQLGDCVYAWKQPTSEIVHAYVTQRYEGTENLYYCLDPKYDNTLKTTKKVPDEQGWYYMTFACQGKHVTYKTKDVNIVNSIEYLAAPAVSLVLDGDVILAVDNATAATGGPRLVRGYKVVAIDGSTITAESSSGYQLEFYMTDDVEIYNVSKVVDNKRGEKASLKVGDTIAAWADWTGEARVVLVTARDVDSMYWKTDRYYSYNTNSTTREPDADGWYWYDMAVNGETKRLKTKDKSIANAVELYSEAFGLYVVGDEIKGAVGASSVKDCSGNGVVNWTVTAVKGAQVSLLYTYPGSNNTGKTKTITLTSGAKIYDISASAKVFGEKTTLKVGDVIRTYLGRGEDKESHQYVYVRARNTRKGGYMSYCDHCDKVVYWNPLLINGSLSSYDSHYFLPGNTTGSTQLTVSSTERDFEVALDLNGYTFTNLDGRATSVRNGDTLTIIDSVGGGKMVGSCTGYDGGVVTLYKGGIFNLYGGTLELTDDETVKPYYGGVVYMYNSETVFNMYGGTIRNGRAYARNEKCGPWGGNVYVQSGTFNMYGGTIENGKAFTGTVTVTNKDGSTSDKLMRGSGGNFYVSSSAKVNIMGGSVVGGWAGDDGYGGNIYSASSKNVINISDATISGGHARRGGNFYGTGTGTWNNASIIDGTAADRGANVMINRGTLTLDGGTKIANGVAGDRGGNMVIYYGTVNFNKCSVDDGVAKKGIGGNMLVLFDAVINIGKDAVISNGSSATNGGNIYLQKNWDSDVMKNLSPVFNMNGGKIVGGTAATGGGIYVEGGTVMDLSGGNIDGEVYLADVATVNISGAPTVKAIYLGKNLLNLGQMTGGNIGITAAGVFTKPVSDAAYVDYFKATIKGSKVDITNNGELTVIENTNPDENPFNDVYQAAVQMTADNVFAGGGTVSTTCPYCDKEVQWTALAENTTEAAMDLESGHYYVAGDLQNNHRYTVVGAVCLHLNGNNITSSDRVFYVNGGTLNVMGDGEVCGSYRSGSNPHFGGTLDSIGKVNLCGGTWLRGSNAPAIGGRPGGSNSVMNIYEGTTIQGDSNHTGYALVSIYADHTFNMWGGKITGGIWDGGTGGNLYVWAGTKEHYVGTVNIYAGTIENGSAAVGGNIYVIGDVSPLAVNITGGTITGGSVFVAGNVDALNVSGTPVIENLDLPNGSLVSLGALGDSAEIKVSAEGVFTAALDDANDYLQYIKSYDDDMVVGTTAAGELTIAYGEIDDSEAVAVAPGVYDYQGVCPCCGKAWSEITWTDIPAGTNITSSYNIDAGGHYRLVGDRQYGRNASHAIRVRAAANGQTVTFDFNGYKLEATGTIGSERLFTVTSGQVLNIVDSSLGRTGTARTTVTAANAIMNDGTLNIYGGSFELGANANANGGIIHHRGAQLNIYGGKFDASAFSQPEKNGGAIYASKPLTIHNAYIVGGNAQLGGAIYADNTSLTIAGGYIEGAVAAIGSGAKVTLSGSPILTCLDMTSDGAITSVTCNGLTKGASIRMAAPEGLIFTRAFASAQTAVKFANYFSVVGYSDVLANAENRLYVAGEKVCPHCGEAWDSITWNEWSFARATKGVVTSGHYYLAADNSAASFYYIGETSTDAQALDVCLDMKGYDLASTNSRLFYIYSGHSLSVINSAAGNATLISKNNVDGGNVCVSGNATLKIYDCALKNNAGGSVSTNVEGGLISAGNGSVVELVGCALTAPNKGIEDGGAVYAQDGSQVTMTNCVITAKKVDKTGSAIAIDKGTVTLNDCHIIGGTALENGTAIAMKGGILTASGGVIYGGDATEQNKAVYTAGSAQVELNGCQVLLNVQAAAPVSPITMFKAWFRNLFQI